MCRTVGVAALVGLATGRRGSNLHGGYDLLALWEQRAIVKALIGFFRGYQSFDRVFQGLSKL